MKNTLNQLKWKAEGYLSTGGAILTGVGTILRSGIVFHDGGLKNKVQLVEGVLRYNFTAARQLRYAAACLPNRTAIIDDLGQITYKEMADDVEALARAFSARGMGPKSRIGVMLRNSRAVIYTLAAKAYIGADIYLLNPASSPAQLQKSILEHKLDLLLIDEEYADHLPADWEHCQVVIGYADNMESPQVPNPEWVTFQKLIDEAPAPKDVKFAWRPRLGSIVIMSSGTSGTPKGVLYKEPIFPITVAGIITKIPWRAEMVVQQTASLFHSWGWANVNVLLAHRCTAILRRHFDPVQAMEDIEKYDVDAIVSSPIFLKEQLKVARTGQHKHKQMQFIASSGNAMHQELVEGLMAEFGPSVQNFYGSTEVSVCAIADAQQLAENPTMAGSPIPGVRLKIMDDEGNVLPPNTPGRIYTRSMTSMKKYTNERDKMHIAQGLLEVGDRGYIDEKGQLFVLGRADDMIIVGGENVYPRSAEEILARMPGVKDLFVKGVEDKDTFQRLAAWIVREDTPEGRALTQESVQEFIREELAEHSVPRDVIWMESLPRNPTGKVMPRMLPQPTQ